MRWQESALCAEIGDPDIFFPAAGANVHVAKKVCAVCPVTAQCLEAARDNREAYGVWGGQSFQDRRPGYPRMKRVDPAAIVELHDLGWGTARMAEAFGISYTTVRRALR